MKNFENLSTADRAELLGCLIDVVEDFLEEKGVLPEKDSEVIICGKDYDALAGRFSNVLGIQDIPTDVKVYYTFGTDPHYPFQGGWVEVTAPTVEKAHELFRKHYPDRVPGILNCSDYYTEDQFVKSGMANGNLGESCHKKIIFIRSK